MQENKNHIPVGSSRHHLRSAHLIVLVLSASSSSFASFGLLLLLLFILLIFLPFLLPRLLLYLVRLLVNRYLLSVSVSDIMDISKKITLQKIFRLLLFFEFAKIFKND